MKMLYCFIKKSFIYIFYCLLINTSVTKNSILANYHKPYLNLNLSSINVFKYDTHRKTTNINQFTGNSFPQLLLSKLPQGQVNCFLITPIYFNYLLNKNSSLEKYIILAESSLSYSHKFPKTLFFSQDFGSRFFLRNQNIGLWINFDLQRTFENNNYEKFYLKIDYTYRFLGASIKTPFKIYEIYNDLELIFKFQTVFLRKKLQLEAIKCSYLKKDIATKNINNCNFDEENPGNTYFNGCILKFDFKKINRFLVSLGIVILNNLKDFSIDVSCSTNITKETYNFDKNKQSLNINNGSYKENNWVFYSELKKDTQKDIKNKEIDYFGKLLDLVQQTPELNKDNKIKAEITIDYAKDFYDIHGPHNKDKKIIIDFIKQMLFTINSQKNEHIPLHFNKLNEKVEELEINYLSNEFEKNLCNFLKNIIKLSIPENEIGIYDWLDKLLTSEDLIDSFNNFPKTKVFEDFVSLFNFSKYLYERRSFYFVDKNKFNLITKLPKITKNIITNLENSNQIYNILPKPEACVACLTRITDASESKNSLLNFYHEIKKLPNDGIIYKKINDIVYDKLSKMPFLSKIEKIDITTGSNTIDSLEDRFIYANKISESYIKIALAKYTENVSYLYNLSNYYNIISYAQLLQTKPFGVEYKKSKLPSMYIYSIFNDKVLKPIENNNEQLNNLVEQIKNPEKHKDILKEAINKTFNASCDILQNCIGRFGTLGTLNEYITIEHLDKIKNNILKNIENIEKQEIFDTQNFEDESILLDAYRKIIFDIIYNEQELEIKNLNNLTRYIHFSNLARKLLPSLLMKLTDTALPKLKNAAINTFNYAKDTVLPELKNAAINTFNYAKDTVLPELKNAAINTAEKSFYYAKDTASTVLKNEAINTAEKSFYYAKDTASTVLKNAKKLSNFKVSAALLALSRFAVNEALPVLTEEITCLAVTKGVTALTNVSIRTAKKPLKKYEGYLSSKNILQSCCEADLDTDLDSYKADLVNPGPCADSFNYISQADLDKLASQTGSINYL